MKMREKVQEQLSDYISHTLEHTETVKHFCDGEPKWSLQRETELDAMRNIKERADQLDKMKKGSNISTVVGILGGVLSIVGLALAPVTAGVSLALTLTGVGLGVTSGVNSLVTGITEMAVNNHQGKNANNLFSQFMEDEP